MRKRIRTAFMLVAIPICSLMLVGCGKNMPGPPTPTPKEPAATDQPGQTNKPASSPMASSGGQQPSATPTPTQTPAKTPAPPMNGNVPSEQAKKLIAERSSEVIAALKNKDMKKLAGFVHPVLGVRFSPYTHVDTKKDLVFQANQLEKLLTDPTKRTWGEYDGSGEPITLPFADYYGKFVYNHDFAKPEKLSYNEAIGKGNMVNNTREAYPDAIIVEYYFSGFDKKLEGLDWSSLKLIYQNSGTQWYLRGVVHDQWTI